jgi:hypothetical protein
MDEKFVMEPEIEEWGEEWEDEDHPSKKTLILKTLIGGFMVVAFALLGVLIEFKMEQSKMKRIVTCPIEIELQPVFVITPYPEENTSGH